MFFRLICSFFVCLAVSGVIIPESKSQGIFSGWLENDVYDCGISGSPVDFGIIPDIDLNNKRTNTKLVADCTRHRWSFVAAGKGGYCIAIRGGEADSGGSMRVLHKSDGGSGAILFSFYNPEGANPIGSNFDNIDAVIHGGTGRISWGENAWGYFNMDFPVDVILKDSRANKSDGSIGGGLYQNSFIADMYYGAMNWLPKNWFWRPRTIEDCISMPKHIAGSFTVRATVKSSCSVSVENHINFGKIPSYQLENGLNAPEGRIKAHCSKGIGYQVGLSAGLHKDKALSNHRAMQRNDGSSSKDFIAYDLYRDSAHIQPWTDIWGSGNTAQGTGADGDTSYPVYAFVPPQNTDKNAGIYQDTVRVEIRINAR